MAVLKSGAAYVPLDLDHPAGRIAAVLEDTRPVAVIAAGGSGAAIGVAGSGGEGVRVLDLDSPDLLAELARTSDAPSTPTN